MTGEYLLREVYIHPMNSRRALQVLRSAVDRPGRSADLLGAFYAIGISGSTQFKVLTLERVLPEREEPAAFAGSGVRVEQRRLRPGPGPQALSVDAAGCAAPLFTYEITTVRGGAGAGYLDALIAERAPVLVEHGHRLVGSFTAVGEPSVVVLWACNVEAHIGLRRAYDAAVGLDDPGLADPRLVDWRRQARNYVVGSRREHLMVPFAGSVLAPKEG